LAGLKVDLYTYLSLARYFSIVDTQTRGTRAGQGCEQTYDFTHIRGSSVGGGVDGMSGGGGVGVFVGGVVLVLRVESVVV